MGRLYIIAVFLLGSILAFPFRAKAEGLEQKNVLIITSNNPEAKKINETITAFMEQFNRRGGMLNNVFVENMSCKSFMEVEEWKLRMRDILKRHNRTEIPSLVILMGPEAVASYISQDTEFARNTPVMINLMSSSIIELPDDTITDLRTWQPEIKDVFTQCKEFNIIGGVVCHIEIEKNIDLMKRFYPETDTIAFLSDNSLGGVLINSKFKKVVKKYPELKVKSFDGRYCTLQDMIEQLGRLDGKNTCLMIGSWRIDSSDNYNNTTHLLRAANTKLPTFTLAYTGLGHWPMGGYVPADMTKGKELADMACDFFQTGKSHIDTIANVYVFDRQRLQIMDMEKQKLPGNAIILNDSPAFYEENPVLTTVIASAFLILGLGLSFSLLYIRRINQLHSQLEKQGQELLIAKDKAEESNRMKTAFLASMSHEIRTPLNAIVGFSELLTDEGVQDEGSRSVYSEIIRKNSDLLLHLINDVLDIARIEAGRIKLEYETCDVVELCRMALATIEHSRKSEVRFEEDFPVQSLELTTDTQRLKQVLINLLSNAVKFTPKGFIRLSLKIDEGHQMIEFSVTDTGCGIPVDKAETVFERFEKLNEHAQGTGLGLSICKLIIEKLGGKIWLDKTYTDGARFVFTLPLLKSKMGGVNASISMSYTEIAKYEKNKIHNNHVFAYCSFIG